MNSVRSLIHQLGGPTRVAADLQITKQAVLYWCRNNMVPARQQPRLVELAAAKGITLSTFGVTEAA